MRRNRKSNKHVINLLHHLSHYTCSQRLKTEKMSDVFRVFSPTVLQLPLQKGGLGILNPSVQQLALQFRWLTPLIQEARPSSIASQWLGAHMISLSTVPIPDQRFPFIFPALRRGLLHSRRPGICSILYRAFDSLFGKTLIVDKLNVPLDQSPHLSPTFCLL